MRIVTLLALALLAGCEDGPLKVGGLCQGNADCPPSQVCVGGFCSATCATDSDCPSGQICRDNVCLKACAQHTECEPGTSDRACVEGGCEPVLPPGYAYAGDDLEVGEGDVVTLSANGSFVIGDDPTFTWELVGSVPKGAVAVLEPVSGGKGDGVVAGTVRFDAPAVLEDTRLTFRLTLSAPGGASSEDTMEVTVQNSVNEPPVADAVASISQAEVGDEIELSAEASTDPNPADTLTFTWTFVDEGTGAELTLAVEDLVGDGSRIRVKAPALPVATSLLARVTVSDGRATDEAAVAILVAAAADWCDPAVPDSCDDGSSCTADSCGADSLCVRVPTNEGKGCDDGDLCTGDGACAAGVCAGAPPVVCDDGLSCTDDSCDGGCVYRPNGQPCDLEGQCPKPVITVVEGTAVKPQTVLQLSGAKSIPHDAAILGWSWAVVEPPGSHGVFKPSPDVVAPTFTVDVAGVYRFSLTVTDDAGLESCAPTELEVVVAPAALIYVEVTWDTPGDSDQSDTGFKKGADLDLHVLHPQATGPDVDGDGEPDGWFNVPYDCFWFNPTPSWPATLERDDVDGAGPESLSFQQLEAGAVYRIGVHYWDDNGFGPSTATVRVWVEGELTLEVATELTSLDLWRVATIGPGPVVQPRSGSAGGWDIAPGYVDPTFTPQ